MKDSRQLIIGQQTSFPALRRGALQTLQVNLGYRCNLSCVHCHVNAGPTRTEEMDRDTVALVLDVIDAHGISCLDLTGGAPEMNPHFRYLVSEARKRGVEVIDRCNLTILLEDGHEDLADFLADQGVRVVASLPCYLEDNVEKQRGKGVYAASIEAIRRLNARGFGQPDGERVLDLVYNPVGASLPPAQAALEADYKRELGERFGIAFNGLLTITNMPISRFGAVLTAQGQFEDYMALLRDNHSDSNLASVMCRSLVSVDYQGFLYDCDFNQMLDIPLGEGAGRKHLKELLDASLEGNPVRVAEHCYGCTAGAGSSCSGALN
ncbi:MAG: arsenosugar biosynthesis radical SAM protein ArsS [Alcanivoracaceae bacterium]|jgi:radical SAM/Cys-rich protein|nr:arsenosugar biosynthesis radical SAM protein ArsS [Alcanivoracaceae bacterium]